jgi:hypothetical protein
MDARIKSFAKEIADDLGNSMSEVRRTVSESDHGELS